MGTLITFFLHSGVGRVVGLVLIAAALYGGIYAKGYFAAREAAREQQQRRNDDAAKDRKNIDKAVPRLDWDRRVDELQ